MKVNIAFSIIFLLNIGLSNQKIYFKDLVPIKVDGQTVYIDYLTRNPISGNITIKTDLGERKKGTLIDGKIEGEWIKYFESGHVFIKEFYKNGILNDWQYVYSTVGSYTFGVQESVLIEKYFYLNGVEAGPCSSWTDNGDLISTYDIKDGARVNFILHTKSKGD